MGRERGPSLESARGLVVSGTIVGAGVVRAGTGTGAAGSEFVLWAHPASHAREAIIAAWRRRRLPLIASCNREAAARKGRDADRRSGW
jgi:hypothetical protein